MSDYTSGDNRTVDTPQTTQQNSEVARDRDNGSREATTAVNSTEAQQGKRITTQGKEELRKHFSGPPKYSRNQRMPMENANHALDAIISKHELSRAQASRQLRNWKMEIYEQSTLTVSASAEDIEIRIRDSISLSPEELVQELMADVCGHAHTNNSSIIQEEDARLYAAFQQMRPDLIPILHELAQTENSSHPCFTLLVCVIDTFTVLAGQLFPEAAKTLPDVELMFTSKREEQLLEFVQDWSEKCYDLTSVLSMTEESRRAVFVMLEMFLFLKWSRASSETDVPPIIFPSGNLVSKYAQPVVYYTAGWVLSRLVLAKTVAEHMRRPYQLFAMHHSITKEESRGAGLPTDLTDQREKKSLVRSSAEFFAIIQSIESVFLANLNLKMMLAFTDGSLCDEIRRGILNNELIVKIFFGLCDEVVEMPLDEGIRRDVLGFVMKRYVNMRGRWFIKIMKGQRKIDQGDAVMKDGATRTRVAAAAACSKAKGTASKEPNERKAYMEAKTNVVNAVDTDTDDESDGDGE